MTEGHPERQNCCWAAPAVGEGVTGTEDSVAVIGKKNQPMVAAAQEIRLLDVGIPSQRTGRGLETLLSPEEGSETPKSRLVEMRHS